MAQLAIKGHPTRGKEVIKILEMLGGRKEKNLGGSELFCWYYINENGDIDYKHYSLFTNTKVFTLEEFLKKFPYKVGDKVSIDQDTCTVLKRWWDESVNEVAYYIEGTNIKGTTYIKDLKPYKEQETMKNTRVSINDNGDKVSLVTLTSEITEIEVGKNYEIKEVNGKYYAVKKKPQYPKSYEECCRIVNASPYVKLVYNIADGQTYSYDVDNLHVYENLRRLKICRDAYWKIAGEQMGLGKPWEPDWNEQTPKYTIVVLANELVKRYALTQNFILVFPTEEMRNAFYENFKDLIEQCKELL